MKKFYNLGSSFSAKSKLCLFKPGNEPAYENLVLVTLSWVKVRNFQNPEL